MNTIHNHMVFVFGSNEGGIHGAGAARHALQHRGAILGMGYGHTTSKGKQAFAIPTKDYLIRKTLSLSLIKTYVDGFLTYARGRPDLTFQVTCIGCGLAGLRHSEIAPLFEMHPTNCLFDMLWAPGLPMHTKFWGTF